MSNRTSDTLTAVAAIAGIVIIVSLCICNGIDETIIKLGMVAIAGLAGFSLANLVRKQ
jgi:hypothetical protein